MHGGHPSHFEHTAVDNKNHQEGAQEINQSKQNHEGHTVWASPRPVERAAPVTLRRGIQDRRPFSPNAATLQKRSSSTLQEPGEQGQSRHGQSFDPDPHQHRCHQANRHPHFVAHRVHDVVVALHVDGGDGEDGSADQAHAEEEVAPAQGFPVEGSAREHAQGHQHQGCQQVHHTQVEDKGKLVELGGLGNDRHDGHVTNDGQQIHE